MSDEIRDRMVAVLPRLRRFAHALTGNTEQADDLVQDACLRALSRIDLWQPGTRLDSWMYRIAQNIWLDRLRANKVRGEMLDLEATAGIAGSDGRVITESELTLQAVATAMGRLPPEQRATVALVCIEGASYKEAAEISGVPVGTVMSRLARARRTLSAMLNQPQRVPEARLTAKAGS